MTVCVFYSSCRDFITLCSSFITCCFRGELVVANYVHLFLKLIYACFLDDGCSQSNFGLASLELQDGFSVYAILDVINCGVWTFRSFYSYCFINDALYKLAKSHFSVNGTRF